MTGQTRAQPEQLAVRERKAGVSENINRAGGEADKERGPEIPFCIWHTKTEASLTVTGTKQLLVKGYT